MFARHVLYRVLICREHRCAVYGIDKHLKQHHSMTAAERRALITSYKDSDVLPPAEVAQPAPYGPPIDALGPAQDAFLCRSSSSSGGGGGGSSNTVQVGLVPHSGSCLTLTKTTRPSYLFQHMITQQPQH
jgi:hypothetical protein